MKRESFGNRWNEKGHELLKEHGLLEVVSGVRNNRVVTLAIDKRSQPHRISDDGITALTQREAIDELRWLCLGPMGSESFNDAGWLRWLAAIRDRLPVQLPPRRRVLAS